MLWLQYHTQLLIPLQGLSRLYTLRFDAKDSTGEGLDAVCQLTGLTHLTLFAPETAEPLRVAAAADTAEAVGKLGVRHLAPRQSPLTCFHV
jgi:hypothetical protein